MRSLVAACCALTMVAGCDSVGDVMHLAQSGVASARDEARDYLAHAVKVQCRRSDDDRKAFITDVNDRLEADGSTARIVAFDCNGDNTPDL